MPRKAGHVQRESSLDRSCARIAKKGRCLWIKLNANTAGVGMPDRLLVSDVGKIVWCELKSTRGILSVAQHRMQENLRRRSHRVVVIREPRDMQLLVDSLNRA
jgi:hypothetical protein